ncbi:MAG TPA: flagellar biosynthetic protein FliO [Candidatus Angelobacter sp.]|nr:flagellar biosynthetic protein FliO [Candidatus Angelobacter sp.]
MPDKFSFFSFAAQKAKVDGRWQWLARLTRLLQSRARPQKQLRLCETLGLGERRFLAVVQFGQEKFLIGGTGNSLALLTHLPHTGEENGAGTEDNRRDRNEVPKK